MKKFKIVKKPVVAVRDTADADAAADAAAVDPSFRLIDFNVYDCVPDTNTHSASSSSSDNADDSSVASGSGGSEGGGGGGGKGGKGGAATDTNEFRIQMFGINEQGETCSIFVDDYHPFFYVMVADHWTTATNSAFIRDIKQNLKSRYFENSVIAEKCEIVEKRKLYGFDGGKNHKFVLLVFKNTTVMNRVKNLWFHDIFTPREGKTRALKPDGYSFANTKTYIYEANIPPILRFFHIQKISPSGWVTFSTKKTRIIEKYTTTCQYEYRLSFEDIIPQNEKETVVPYKICSFDIEASSSHGDFPIPVKSYKKLATNIVDAVIAKHATGAGVEITDDELTHIIYTAFQYSYQGRAKYQGIETIYPKRRPKEADMARLCRLVLSKELRHLIKHEIVAQENTIEQIFMNMAATAKQEAAKAAEAKTNLNANANGSDSDGESDDDDDRGDDHADDAVFASRSSAPATPTAPTATADLSVKLATLLNNPKHSRETKITIVSDTLGSIFPKVEGDKVTFIGSTFVKYGQDSNRPYLSNCIVLDTCDNLHDEVPNSEIESYTTEADVLLAWTRLIQRENPDIIIGYNIFGFDYQFMFRRAVETGCYEEFLKLSRNRDELCANAGGGAGAGGGYVNPNTEITADNVAIEQTKIALASGQYDLHFVKMTGRLQVDVYNYLRRDFNLSSYKLDDVSSYFIGDAVKNVEYDPATDTTRVFSSNLLGLEVGNFVKFEQTNHSTDLYKDGHKFKVVAIAAGAGFTVNGQATPDMKTMVRWGLAKDDVSPQDIFRMTNEGPKERAVIAKYCIQDCNLVHHLMNKIDIITGYTEMAKICSVPISFLVMRGQGIKLTSYVAMKCREKNTLMPVIDKDRSESGYEGAIVLPPKCGLYLDNPVACNDYSSLYPSSMISENLSHDSKVWTKEYDLDGQLIRETGESCYDNLPGYKYVDITYDTYRWTRPKSMTKTASAAVKVKCGTKVCRFAQFPEGEKGIMPAILEELLTARKTTRKLAEKQTDAFMANILDKRQLGYKVTANSLYGQCGAKTSTFTRWMSRPQRLRRAVNSSHMLAVSWKRRTGISFSRHHTPITPSSIRKPSISMATRIVSSSHSTSRHRKARPSAEKTRLKSRLNSRSRWAIIRRNS